MSSGEPRFGQTSQGYADHSCWSRGQAWAIYGMPLSYAYTKEETRAHDAERVTNYYLNRSRLCVLLDLIFTEGQEETARRRHIGMRNAGAGQACTALASDAVHTRTRHCAWRATASMTVSIQNYSSFSAWITQAFAQFDNLVPAPRRC